MSASWKTPRWHGECIECGLAFEGRTVKDTNAAMDAHEDEQGDHECGWVAVCGCHARFGPGNRTEVTRALGKHLAARDYEPLSFLEEDA